MATPTPSSPTLPSVSPQPTSNPPFSLKPSTSFVTLLLIWLLICSGKTTSSGLSTVNSSPIVIPYSMGFRGLRLSSGGCQSLDWKPSVADFFPQRPFVWVLESGEFSLELEEPERYVSWCSVDPYPATGSEEQERSKFLLYFNGPKLFEVTVQAGEILYL
ncbi:hypothetical protein REPUB_Repub20aG0051700 [Reevesia pubescens]